MRAVRSFDPCLPCGVHMYLGKRQDDQAGALADVRRSTAEAAAWTTARHASGSRGSRRCSRRSRRSPDPAARETATELVAGAARPLRRGAGADRRHVAERDDGSWRGAGRGRAGRPPAAAARAASRCPLEERVRGALEEVRPYLESHGGGVELRRRRGRRRAAAAGGQLQRLPVLGGDAEARDRGRDPARPRPTSRGSRPRARSSPRRRRRRCSSSRSPRARAAHRPRPAAWATAGGAARARRRRDARSRRSPASRCCSCALDGRSYAYRPALPGLRRVARRRRRCAAPSSRARPAATASTRGAPGAVPRRAASCTSSRCRCSSTTTGLVKVALGAAACDDGRRRTLAASRLRAARPALDGEREAAPGALRAVRRADPARAPAPARPRRRAS